MRHPGRRPGKHRHDPRDVDAQMSPPDLFTERDPTGEPYWLWRYEGRGYADSGSVQIVLRRFDIVDRTPRTLVLMNDWGERTRVLRGQGKRYAHEERAWAWDSFTRRAQRRLEILTASLADAQLVRRHIDAIKEPPTGAYYHHPGLPEFNP